MIRGISSESLTQHDGKTRPIQVQKPFPRTIKKPNLLTHTSTTTDTASHRFHFSNFRYYLTLFSKFFASFPHGTCSLSVSHQYLALDGIYHPLRAAIPNNSTRRKLNRTTLQCRHERGCHPPRRSIPGDFTSDSC